MTPDQLPAGLPMDDKIEACGHGLLRLVLQHARAYADNSDPAKTEAALRRYLRLPPHNARRFAGPGGPTEAHAAAETNAVVSLLDRMHEETGEQDTGSAQRLDMPSMFRRLSTGERRSSEQSKC